MRITLVDGRNFHIFQPLLYQVATASPSPADIESPLSLILERQRNAEVIIYFHESDRNSRLRESVNSSDSRSIVA